MKVFILVSGHCLGSTDAGYLHGVFTSREKAEDAAKSREDSVVVEATIDSLIAGDPSDYHKMQGYRVV